MKITIPATVAMLLRQLQEAGFSAYAVGGCVRDSLLGSTPQDWDICTSARPEETKACFSHLPTILTGERYGTVTVLLKKTPYEITTFRAESGYADSRHPEKISFLNELPADLSRRDFTVNAMAADLNGEITDCFGGQADLERKVIRCVGTPEARFTEDALRMLRALRFAARLDFSLDAATAAAIHREKSLLLTVAPERLRKELSGLLVGKGVLRILEEFSDVLFLLIPELAAADGFLQYNPNHKMDVWHHTLHTVASVEPEECLRLAALLHDVGKPAAFTFDKHLVGHFYGHAVISAAMSEDILRRLRFDNQTVRSVTTLVQRHDSLWGTAEEKQLRRLLSRVGETQTRQLIRLRRADRLGKGTEDPSRVEADTLQAETILAHIMQAQQCFSLRQLAINGRDLLALGIPPGPAVGRFLDALLDAVVAGTIQNDREFLVRYAQNLANIQESN